MVGIIDYGMGNLGSVQNACRYLGREARIINDPAHFSGCSALVLPGVGAFGDCMKNLQATGFAEQLIAWTRAGKLLLGICLGLQVLFESSEESPGVAGLGIFKGEVVRFQQQANLKIPQIGWNRVALRNRDCPLFRNIADGAFFYFVHSYYVAPAEHAVCAGETDYGRTYTSVAFRDNVMATQFHPEKSHDAGLRMLDNFCALATGEKKT